MVSVEVTKVHPSMNDGPTNQARTLCSKTNTATIENASNAERSVYAGRPVALTDLRRRSGAGE
jgi:hypothetical protein